MSGTGGLSGPNSSTFIVNPARADHLAFSVQPDNTTAGTVISPLVQVEVFDSYGNVLTTDSTDTVTLTVANAKTGQRIFAGGSLQESAQVRDGVATFSNLVVDTAASSTYPDTLSASAPGIPTSATSNSFTVSPAAVSSFAVSPSTSEATAGVGFNVSIRARDIYGNTVTNYPGSAVTLTSSDGQTVTPGSITLSKGTANPSITLDSVDGSVTLTASAGAITGRSNAFSVNGGNGPSTNPVAEYAFSLYVEGAPGSSPQLLGPADVAIYTIIAQNDAQAQLFIANQESLLQQQDNLEAGSMITTVNPANGTDSVMKSPVGQNKFVSDNLTIIRNVPNSGAPGSAASFALSFQAIAQSDSLQQVTVTALDSNGDVVTDYTGSVTLSSDDPLFGLPITYTFTPADQGSHSLIVQLDTAGIQSLMVTDPNSGSLTGQAIGSGGLTAQDAADQSAQRTGAGGYPTHRRDQPGDQRGGNTDGGFDGRAHRHGPGLVRQRGVRLLRHGILRHAGGRRQDRGSAGQLYVHGRRPRQPPRPDYLQEHGQPDHFRLGQ